MDPFSEVLRVVHLVGAVFVQARFTAPWGYQSPRADVAAPLLEPTADRIVIFHLITEGGCWLEMDGAPPLHATAGQVLVIPHGDAHRMTSELGLAPSVGVRLQRIFERRPLELDYGGGGAVTRTVCGYLACDSRAARLLLNGLPRALCVDVRGSNAGGWLEASMRYALEEARSPRAGGEGVLAKLAELLFIEVLRQYMHERTGEDGRTGWLAAMRDRLVGAALAAMHRDVARDWTVEELARVSGTSRSVLAERFLALVGSSPIQYLTHWRMLRAAHLMRTTNAPLLRIAEDVGYRADTAFNRAFRREFGVPPATWRRQRSTRTGAAAAPTAGPSVASPVG